MAKKLTELQKRVLKELVGFRCEICGKHEKEAGELQIHRIRRGFEGGEYIPSNIKVVCKNCHQLLHYGEFE